MTTFSELKQKLALIWPHLDERARRMMAANEARQLGYGGVSKISRACGLSRVTITKGMRELRDRPLTGGRIRRPGGGRPTLVRVDPELPRTLEGLVEPLARGDPESPLQGLLGVGVPRRPFRFAKTHRCKRFMQPLRRVCL